MDHITEAFYNVMYQYRLAFTPDGVQANLNQWRQQKTPLLELLRRHPNWREQELAVVFDLSEQRQLDRACVDETKFEMLTLAEEAGLTSERLEEFRDALDAATADYATVPDESRLPVIRNRGHIKCDAGMKASRIINRLCAKFGIDQYEAERELGHGDTLHTARVKPYNAVFARLADALNPVRISKTGVLSVHPCDFLEMSAKKNAWHSCHCLFDGGWRAGCQSYMGDGVSMVFFTVDDEINDNFYRARRLTRQIFCYRDGVLMQSRLYPQNDDDVRKLYRSIVQGVIARCLGLPNLWKTNTTLTEIRSYWTTVLGSLHYTDYENGYAALSLIKGCELYGHLNIGSVPHCIGCGRPHEHGNSTRCGKCEELCVCQACGDLVQKQSGYYTDEEGFFCADCMQQCDCCGSLCRRERLIPVLGRRGEMAHLCRSCVETELAPCGTCVVRECCTDLRGVLFCAKSRYTQIRTEEQYEQVI